LKILRPSDASEKKSYELNKHLTMARDVCRNGDYNAKSHKRVHRSWQVQLLLASQERSRLNLEGDAGGPMQTKLLILDLDETLVFATEEKLSGVEDFRVGEYFVYKRPGLDRFITFAFAHFRVAVWTSSGADYAKQAISRVFPDFERLEFAWTKERCTLRHDSELQTRYWIKDLKKVRRLGHSLENILVVDDSPRKLERNYGNHICIAPFEGDPADHEFERLEAYLLWLKDIANVRSVNKRHWRTVPPAKT
jgi:TFIIF-interacting CTD phosphatase-like protein